MEMSRLLLVLIVFSASGLAQNSSKENLRQQIERIAGDAKGRVGVSLTVLETGESVAYQGEQQFPMQSVYKLPIGMAVLAKVDQGVLKLSQGVRVEKADLVPEQLHSPIRNRHPQGVELTLQELLRFMVSESDGTACDVLLRVLGGPPAVDGYLRGLNINGIKVVTTEREMAQDEMVQYRNWARPSAMTQLLRELQIGNLLSSSSHKLLLGLMTQTPTGPRRLKGLLPNGVVVAHKTGTSNTVKGLTRATNDVGLITLPNGQHLAVAVFIMDSRADVAVRERVIARIAKAGWDFWSARPKS
jgi:beta-lactamase class A